MSNQNKENVAQRSSLPIRILAVIGSIILFGIIACLIIKNNYLNVLSVGEKYLSVHDKNIKNILNIFEISFVSIFVYFLVINMINKKGLKKFFDEDKKKMPRLPNKSAAFIFALFGSLVSCATLTNKYLMFSNAAVFGKTDPIFGMDMSYYFFTLPFYQSLLFLIGEVLVVSLVYVAVYYVLTLNKCLDGVNVETLKQNIFLKEISCIVLLITLVVSTYIFMNSQNILTSEMLSIESEKSINLVGANNIDVSVKVNGYRILSVVVFAAVIVLLKSVKKNNFRVGFIAVFSVPAYMLILGVIMLGVEMTGYGNNELDNEQNYIAYNIKNTKVAYGIDIDQQNINSYKEISTDEIDENEKIFSNVPIITENIINTSILEHQENTAYYNYENTFLAEYKVNGINKLLYVTPREILDNQTVSYNKKTYTNTHGYSLVVNTTTDSDLDGYSEYVLSDFENENVLGITEPRIYYGAKTESNVITNTKLGKEYDYPLSASTYEENIYDGESGLEVSFLDRIVLGITNQDIKLIANNKLTADSKVLINRNIIDRAKAVLPGILYDENPYLVITEKGRLVWVLDGYTRSDAYPYSQKTVIEINGSKEKINYIRNSVKVLIDAYDGTTTFYITDKTDPIIMTYRNIYPEVFAKTSMPEDIVGHLVYPKFLYQIQAEMINIYHDISENSLYRAEDIWEISSKPSSSAKTSAAVGEVMKPYYTMLKTNDSSKPELGLLITYNKSAKQNIAAYLVGKVVNGKSELSLYKFNSENNVIGMMQLTNQIDQDATISKELEKLNTTGTKLVKGMIIVPVNNSLLYIEPIYQVMLNESEIPVLKRVIVASGNTVAIGNDLRSAITNLFNEEYSVDIEIVNNDDIMGLIDSAIKANNNLKESMESNNFEMVGKDIQALQTILNQIEVTRQKELDMQTGVEPIVEENEPIDNTVSNDVKNVVGNTNVKNNVRSN